MIRNTTDLFKLFGVDSEARLSRRLYKDTECGAWAKLVPPGKRKVGTRRETWTARVTNSIVGPKCFYVRKKGGKTMSSIEAPMEVQTYMTMGSSLPFKKGDAQTLQLISWEGICDLSPEGQVRDPHRANLLKVTRRGSTVYVTFEVPVAVMEAHDGGVLIGSIVEGSDAEVMPEELIFPFTEEELDRAVQNVEDDADMLWREANE